MAAKMCEQGLNPGYFQARAPLPSGEWLSDTWFEAYRQVLDRTNAAGMHVGYTAGEPCVPDGRLLARSPELESQSLRWTLREVAATEEVELPASLFTVAARVAEQGATVAAASVCPRLIESATLAVIGAGGAFRWRPPGDGVWRVYTFSTYHQVAPGGTRVSLLDRRTMPAWVEVEFDQYAAHTKRGQVPGMFLDLEGSYGYKLAWSPDLADEYAARKATDLRLWMPLLIDEDIEGRWGKARWDWYDVVSALYVDCALTPLDDWCREQGMYLTCHLWEENLSGQALQTGDFMAAQRAYSLPGTDSLFLGVMSVRDFKETQSVAEFEGRQYMSEILGVSGWHLSPATMKAASNSAIAWGLSHLMAHGINTNRDLDTVSYPPDFFDSNPYWPHLSQWTDFCRRACFMNAHGHLAADVLLLCPMDTVWALLGDGIFDAELPITTYPIEQRNRHEAKYGEMIGQVDAVYSQAMADLAAGGVQFLIGDRHYLRQMTVNAEGTLQRDPFTFATVVLPPLVMLPLEVGETLVAFARSGGHVYLLGDVPHASTENGMHDPQMVALMAELGAQPTVRRAPDGLRSLIEAQAPGLRPTVRLEAGAFPLLVAHRRLGDWDCLWLANNTGAEQTCEVVARGVHGLASIWNCESGAQTPVASQPCAEGSRLTLHWDAYEGYWLVFDRALPPLQEEAEAPPDEVVMTLEGLWRVWFEADGQPALGGHALTPPAWLRGGQARRPLQSWLDWGLREFSGLLDYSVTLKMDATQDRLFLDLGEVKHTAEVWCNGRSLGARLWPPFRFELTEALLPGENILRVRVGNLVINAIAQNRSYKWPWYGPPTDDLLASGLLGPVVVLRQKHQTPRA